MPKISKSLSKRKPFRMLNLMEEEETELFAQFLKARLLTGHADQQLETFFIHCQVCQVWRGDWDREGFLQESNLKMTNNTFDKVVSRLYQQLMGFAGVRAVLMQPNLIPPLAIAYLSETPIPGEELEKKVTESHRILEKFPPKADVFRAGLDLQLVKAHAAQSRSEKPGDRELGRLHDELDAYYYIQKLRFLCASINEKQVFYTTWSQEGEEELMTWLALVYPTMPILAQTYYHAFRILSGKGEEQDFSSFRERLGDWEEAYGQDQEITDLYGYLLNYYSIRYNRGDLAVLIRIDELLGDLLVRGTLLEGGKLSPEYLKNMVNVKCRLGQIAQARHLFTSYITQLTDDQDGAALQYNTISLAFYEGKLEAVQKGIEPLLESPEATKVDVYYGLDLRCLLLKTYFLLLGELDIGAWDVVDERLRGLLRSFKAYIERKQIPPLAKIPHENFRKGIQRLLAFHYPQSLAPQEEREELLLDFSSSSNLLDKGWFIKQVSDGA